MSDFAYLDLGTPYYSTSYEAIFEISEIFTWVRFFGGSEFCIQPIYFLVVLFIALLLVVSALHLRSNCAPWSLTQIDLWLELWRQNGYRSSIQPLILICSTLQVVSKMY